MITDYGPGFLWLAMNGRLPSKKFVRLYAVYESSRTATNRLTPFYARSECAVQHAEEIAKERDSYRGLRVEGENFYPRGSR